jgi:hypothetical protein
MTTVFYSARDGRTEVFVTTTDTTGRVVTTEVLPINSKPDAIAYAKRIGARFTA